MAALHAGLPAPLPHSALPTCVETLGLVVTDLPPWFPPATPTPRSPFSFSLSHFRKEASSAAPSGTPPPAQIPSAEKKPDPPMRPARPPDPSLLRKLTSDGVGWGLWSPPTPCLHSAIPAASFGWTELVLSSSPAPFSRQGNLPCPLPF